jgi:hypothetical protein
MSYQENKESPAIRRMCWKFHTVKEITAHLNVDKRKVSDQFERLGLRKAWITDEEKALILAQRKQKGLIRNEK